MPALQYDSVVKFKGMIKSADGRIEVDKKTFLYLRIGNVRWHLRSGAQAKHPDARPRRRNSLHQRGFQTLQGDRCYRCRLPEQTEIKGVALRTGKTEYELLPSAMPRDKLCCLPFIQAIAEHRN